MLNTPTTDGVRRYRVVMLRGNTWATAVLIAGIAVATLAGCAGSAAEREPPNTEFLRMVTPEVDMTLWTEDELIRGGRQVCAELDSTNGDKDAVAAMLMAGVSSEDDPAIARAWMRDVSAIEAGAVLYFCPEWTSSYE